MFWSQTKSLARSPPLGAWRQCIAPGRQAAFYDFGLKGWVSGILIWLAAERCLFEVQAESR